MRPDRKGVLPIRLFALVCLLVIADQISKAVVRAILPPGSSIPLIDDVLRITFVPNFAGFSWWVPPLPAWVRVAFQVVLCFIVLAAFPVYIFYTHTRHHSIWADIGFVGVVASVVVSLIFRDEHGSKHPSCLIITSRWWQAGAGCERSPTGGMLVD
jgi:lipoprotein signal peptidase